MKGQKEREGKKRGCTVYMRTDCVLCTPEAGDVEVDVIVSLDNVRHSVPLLCYLGNTPELTSCVTMTTLLPSDVTAHADPYGAKASSRTDQFWSFVEVQLACLLSRSLRGGEGVVKGR